ncbi:MAG: FlgD immunoglobulin-like domain containing protein, partial [Armatimonadota bacterium]|nr:FlgD immunoglobulin-like domain containing protein [Armatimonadota bacterium]
QDAANLLGLPSGSMKLATWNGARYAFYPEGPADRFRLGTGYFMKLDSAIALGRQGSAADVSRPFPITLRPGWNMIGNPFSFIVNWFDAKVQVGQEVIPLQDAISRDLVKNALWTYGNGQYRLAFQLVPWEGYWVKATQEVTLLVPNVAGRGRVEDPYRTRAASEEAWLLQLVASAGVLTDAANYAGVSRAARDGYDQEHDVLEAPPTSMGDWVQLTFPHRAGWGAESGDYAVDLRSPGAEKSWDFEVSTSLAHTDVTLQWPNANRLPKRYSAILEDVDTGARRYLRSCGSYTFQSGPAGSARRFRLRVVPQEQVRLSVTGLQVAPNRSGGGALISFTLSDTASVRVRVLSAAGRVVRQVSEARVMAPGVNSVSWDGRDARGVGLGYGLFICQVEATAEDGRTVQEVRPFVNVR